MKKTLASILLALCAATTFGAFERLATETYPGGSQEAATKALIDSEVGGTNAVKAAVSTVTSSAATWNAKYAKPTGGIPSTDLSTDVQTSLGKADSALQDATAFDAAGTATSAVTTHDTDARHVATGEKAAWNAKYAKPASGIPATDLETTVQTSLGKADTALQDATAFDAAGTATAATNALKTVAHSGSYTDLSNKPTAADIGAYEASKGEADHTTVSNLLAYVGGQNVRVSVTNYYGATSGDLPRLRIEEYQTVTNSGSEISAWNTVWDEDDKFDLFRTNILSGVAVMTNGTITALTSITNAIVQYADQTKAPKAWGMYASDGTLAPSDTVVHATSKTMFGGNTEFKCFAIGTDQVGFLVRKGTTAYSATEPGEFKFYNMSGNHFFGMHIRDEVELGCDTDGIIITKVGSDNMVTLTYNVTMTGKPSIHYAATLDATPIVWEKLSKRDGTQVPGASKAVTWEAVPPAGTEVCHINMGAAPKGFYYATIDDPAESWLHTDLVLNAQGGILCTNEYTGLTANIEPYIDDASNTVKWRVKP